MPRKQLEERCGRACGCQDSGTNADKTRFDSWAEADDPLVRFKRARGNYRSRAEEMLREAYICPSSSTLSLLLASVIALFR